MSRLQDLPLLHPSLTLHLSDPADTPIISSAPPPPSSSTSPSAPQPPSASSRPAALSCLNRSALASYTAAQRLGLGNPVRIIVECAPRPRKSEQDAVGGGDGERGGPVVLNTYIPPLPQQQPAAAEQVNGVVAEAGGTAGDPLGDEADDGSRRPPLLVAVVVAPDGETQTVAEARLAASRLARVGRRLQATWAEEEGGDEDRGV